MQKVKIVVFASGNGSNALNIMSFFREKDEIEVSLLISNRQDAPIVEKAKNQGVEVLVLDNEAVSDGGQLIEICQGRGIDFVILAGYLRKIPLSFVRYYDNKIINIHPSLLPKYGGKGMYGDYVHKAVLDNKETNSGITIHFVNEEFDKGEIIAQFACEVEHDETIEQLRNKIHLLEQQYFPKVVEETILKHNKSNN